MPGPDIGRVAPTATQVQGGRVARDERSALATCHLPPCHTGKLSGLVPGPAPGPSAIGPAGDFGRRGAGGAAGEAVPPGDADHLDRVERVDRGVVLGRAARVSLNGRSSGTGCPSLLEHPDVSLDDQAGILLAQVVVAISRDSRSGRVFQTLEPFLELRRRPWGNRPSCRRPCLRRRAAAPGPPSSVCSAWHRSFQ